MEQPPYSAWADLLAKFHTSPEWIQALWLIAIPALLLGALYHLREIAVAALTSRRGRPGHLVLSVYQDGETLRIYRHAAITSERVLLKALDAPERDLLEKPRDERNPQDG